MATNTQSTTEPAPEAKPTKVRWLVFTLACVFSWLLYLHRYSWGVIKKDIKSEFGLDDVAMGWLDSCFTGAYALLQLPMGFAGDLFGPALVLPLIIIAWSAAFAAPGVATGVMGLGWSRVLFGVAQAGGYPTLSKVTRSWFPVSIRTTLQGLVASFSGRAGGACAALLVGSLLMGVLGLGWRAAIAVAAIGGGIFAVIHLFLFRNTPAEHPWSNPAERRLIEAREDSTAAQETPAGVRRTRFDLRPRALVSFGFLLAQMFVSTFADVLYVYWIPQFLEESKGFLKIEMGIYASLPLWVSAVGGVVGGTLNDVLARRWMSRPAARRVVGMSGKLIAAGFILLSLQFDDGRWCMVVLAGAKFFSDWSQPTVWGALTDIGGYSTGRVFGFANTVGASGAFVAGPIFGAIVKYFGWEWLFVTVFAAYVVCGLCWLGVDSSQKLVVDAEARAE